MAAPTRGIGLCNPGNVRISKEPWQGKLKPSQDTDFETFDTPEHGIRVIARILLTYFERGLKTIDDIISSWAPDSENDTDAYIDDVSDRTGYDSDKLLTADATTLSALTTAIIFHENGQCPYDADLIRSAVDSALGTTQ